MADAINLLLQWQLPQLCSKFRAEQEVCTIALQHLTEADIGELVPKIGPRSIFRANLMEWRKIKSEINHVKTPKSQITTQTQNNTTAETNHNLNENLHGSSVVKLEAADAAELWFDEMEPPQVTFQEGNPANANATNLSNSHQNRAAQDENLETEHDLLRAESRAQDTSARQMATAYLSKPIIKTVNVKDTLHNSFDGRRALQYYAATKTLDNNHRKKVVKTIITVVIERRLPMASSSFHDLARQLIELFPNERYETYYVARVGNICPRGALYNKYLNMGKRLRKDGILEYRISRRTFPLKNRK